MAARCRRLRLVVCDVDGVLTDGTVMLLPGGGEAKGFHVRDGMAIVLAHRAGLRIALVSSRASEVVARRAAELGITLVRQGAADKAAALREMRAELGLAPHEVAYIGDDVNDLPLMAEAGLSAAPADAPMEVRSEAFMVTDAAGGRGCVREFLEAILRARGEWEGLVTSLAAPQH